MEERDINVVIDGLIKDLQTSFSKPIEDRNVIPILLFHVDKQVELLEFMLLEDMGNYNIINRLNYWDKIITELYSRSK